MEVPKKLISELIRESNAIEEVYDPKETGQSLIAWRELAKETKLGVGLLMHTQKTITLHQDDLMPHQRGYTRSLSKTSVTIGGRVAPSWRIVDGLLDNWLLDYADPAQDFDPLKAHIRFEKIHPFVDGNGRTGRMLLWWHQMRKGQEPSMFTALEKFEKYYPLFD